MKSLFELQKSFVKELWSHEGALEIKNNNGLKVHRDNCEIALIKQLARTYPYVQILLGEKFFKQMTQIFVKENHPSINNLFFYGANFAEFLRAHELTFPYKYLYDVANFEWALHYLNYCGDDLTTKNLKKIDEKFIFFSDFDVQKILSWCKNPSENLNLYEGKYQCEILKNLQK